MDYSGNFLEKPKRELILVTGEYNQLRKKR